VPFEPHHPIDRAAVRVKRRGRIEACWDCSRTAPRRNLHGFTAVGASTPPSELKHRHRRRDGDHLDISVGDSQIHDGNSRIVSSGRAGKNSSCEQSDSE
jgi:hypothetical protein